MLMNSIRKLTAGVLIVLCGALLLADCNKSETQEQKAGGSTGAQSISVDVQSSVELLLTDEDTDGDQRITIEDPRIPGTARGDRRFYLKSMDRHSYEIVGTYHLSNLLQEITIARERQDATASIRRDRIFEPPVHRISRMITSMYWDNLTRRIDEAHLDAILKDEKTGSQGVKYLYVPHDDTLAYDYFKRVCAQKPELCCSVVRLDQYITPEYVRGLNGRHGILTLALITRDGTELEGVPFVVPGGRFNEMYGWDSYFESLGLLVDGRIDLAKAMVDNFVYQIRHYGKILNANRTYYLTRSQPPFLTSMIREVYAHLPRNRKSREWLKTALLAAIHEYRNVWTSGARLTTSGLSRYYGAGIGPCPEVSPDNYDSTYAYFEERFGIKLSEFQIIFEKKKSKPLTSELKEFFTHDRAMRESGHDASYRWYTGTDRCADFITVDLNSLLYKYEIDIAALLDAAFGGSLENLDGRIERSEDWHERAGQRKTLIRKYLWNEDLKLFLDFDTASDRNHLYVSAAMFYPMWACHPEDPGTYIISKDEAQALISEILPFLEMPGGIAGSSKESRGERTESRRDRQWDYPYGWAPHQMIAWKALDNYGFEQTTQRLVYRWLYIITRNAVDYNGTVPEKYDVVNRSHKVFAEYGNVGTTFSYITREGFGWMNASYQLGLEILKDQYHEPLNNLIPPEWLF